MEWSQSQQARGLSYRQIAKHMKIGEGTVRRVLNAAGWEGRSKPLTATGWRLSPILRIVTAKN
jgi:transposase